MAAAQDPPTITYFTPTGGPAGTLVKLVGSNFDLLAPANNQVTVNGQPTQIVEVYPDEITFQILDGTATGLVAVSTAAGTAQSTEPFTISTVAIAVDPANANVFVDGTQNLNAIVTGATNPAIEWQVNGIVGGNSTFGTITQANPANYTAPSAVPDPDTVMVAAVSQEEPGVKALVPVQIFSAAGGVPDIDLGELDLTKYSVDTKVGLEMARTYLLVMMKEGASLTGVKPVLAAHNAKIIGGMPETEIMMVEIPDSGGFDEIYALETALDAVPEVEESVQDTLLYPQMVEPKPTGLSNFWYETPTGWKYDSIESAKMWSWEVDPGGKNWGLEFASFPQAWNWFHFIGHGANPIVNVGVIDVASVFAAHRDFAGDPARTVIFLSPATGMYDHSVHVAGTIGALWANRRGITGASPYVRIVSQGLVGAVPGTMTPYTGGRLMLGSFRHLLHRAGGLNIPVVNASLAYNWYSLQMTRTVAGPNVWDWTPLPGPGGSTIWQLNRPRGTPQTEPAEQDMVRQQGEMMLRLSKVTDGSDSRYPFKLIFVAAAGNDRHDLAAALVGSMTDNTAADPTGQAVRNRDSWNANDFRAEFESPYCWAAYHGAQNIMVVEALKPKSNRTDLELADFSCRAIKGDGTELWCGVSAPGVDICSTTLTAPPYDTMAYENMSGTSMAAPHVSGLIAYMRSLDRVIDIQGGSDPTRPNDLGIHNIITILRDTGRTPAGPVARPANRAIDAFQAVKAIDNFTGGTLVVKKALLNIDDGTKDGCDRTIEADSHGPVADDNANGTYQEDEIIINMADFRRFRDGFLQLLGRGAALNGPADSRKRDLNEDDVVEEDYVKENVYPRADFNGDGLITPADLNEMADPAVWDDTDVSADKLSGLISSGDIKIDPAGLFADGINKIKVFARFTNASGGKEVYSMVIHDTDILDNSTAPPTDNRKVFTVPAGRDFVLSARSYVDSEFRTLLLTDGALRTQNLKEGEDKLMTLRTARLALEPSSFMADYGSTAALGLAVEFSDGSREAVDPALFAVTWKVPSGVGEMAASSNGWSFTAGTSPGTTTLEAEVYLDGEPVNPNENSTVAVEVTVRTATIKSPGGMVLDKLGNMYVSDSEEGTVTMIPPEKPGFVLLYDLDKPGDLELGPYGRSLVIAENNGKISKWIFGVSGRLKDLDGNFLVGATVTGQTPITGTPGSGDSISRSTTTADGWFHLFWLLRPAMGKDTVDAVVTVEYGGKAQAYEIEIGPEGQKVQDLLFDVARLTMEIEGEGTIDPAPGVHDYIRKTPVTLSATPAAGWKLDHWTGLDSSENPISVTMFNDVTVRAVFVPEK